MVVAASLNTLIHVIADVEGKCVAILHHST